MQIQFIDSQIAVSSLYFVSCNSVFCCLMIWIKVGYFGVIHFVSMSMQKIISLYNQLPISVVFGRSFHRDMFNNLKKGCVTLWPCYLH